MQIHCPHLFVKESVLYYDITRTPSSESPYYEALVSSMPNIKCQGQNKEDLEQQLLKEYANYLSELVTKKEVVIERPRITPPLWFNEGYILGIDFVF